MDRTVQVRMEYGWVVNYLGNPVRSFLRKGRSQSDDVDHLSEENEEHRDRSAVNARADGPNKHQKVIVSVGKCEEFNQRNLLGLLVISFVRRISFGAGKRSLDAHFWPENVREEGGVLMG
ncbi:hypothetical protein U1Q18_021545 [Sarracenia purpurea var. burkii]